MKLPKNTAARTIYWWNLKVAHKQKNISTTVWYKEKIANVVSNRVKKYCFLASTERQENSQFLSYFYGLGEAYSAGLAQCQIIRNPNKIKYAFRII